MTSSQSKKALPTVTVGIPAHNEAANIKFLIESLVKQKGFFTLEKIIVVCDGCTDNTAEVVQKLSRKYKVIELHMDDKRKGKALRLNEIHAANTSDFVCTFDGDVVLKNTYDIQEMLNVFARSTHTRVVGGRLIPVSQHNVWGKMSVVSYKSFENAVRRLNGGNNYYALVGAASMLRGSFARKMRYPKDIISDMNYLYTVATAEHPDAVRFAWNAEFLISTVTTFHDWRLLGVRSTQEDKHNLVEHFGKEVLQDYHMPIHLYATSLLLWFWKSPLHTFGAIVMNIFIRVFPLHEEISHGIWETTDSSKHIFS